MGVTKALGICSLIHFATRSIHLDSLQLSERRRQPKTGCIREFRFGNWLAVSLVPKQFVLGGHFGDKSLVFSQQLHHIADSQVLT